jgi:SAM-dependent methyltransferase
MNKRREAVLASLDRFSQGDSLKVLDAGCGPGSLAEEIAKRGHKTTGLDYSLDMVAQASRAAESAGTKRASFIQGDLDSLPFQNNSFDAVICVGVLQYLPDDRISIAELGRVLRPGGIAIVTLPNIFRISNFFDPIYYFRGIRYGIHLLARRLPVRKKLADPIDFSTNRMFSSRRYIYGQRRGAFRLSRLTSVEATCIGFGPMTFWKRPYLPERLSLSLSDRLDHASRMSGLRWLRFFSNRWVITFKKDS